ncbi:MAG: hypothetical protein C0483_03955 [Pirellula sp.]|nr:hypothetical protein [Pirellula sp.]
MFGKGSCLFMFSRTGKPKWSVAAAPRCALRVALTTWPTCLLCFGFIGLCVPVGGCGWLQRPAELLTAPFREKEAIDFAEMGTSPIEAALLAKDDWVQAPPNPRRAFDPALPHLVLPPLEPLLQLQGANRPNLLPLLDHPEAPVRDNAAIGLARWGDGRALEPVAAIVADTRRKQALREAAAESLGYITHPSPAPALGRLIDQFGRYEPSRMMDYSPELHGHLLRALGRHVDAAADTRFQEALRAPSLTARQEALAAWGRSSVTELPAAVVDLRADPNPHIRASAIGMILAKRHPRALEFAKNSLQDAETDVRTATIAGLGKHGGAEATAMLDRVMLSEGEVLRAAAVPAYRDVGAVDKVWAAASDKAWRVRRAVAEQLAYFPEQRTAALAYRFLSDSSSEVRKTVVASLDAWPANSAGPVLLAALKEPTYETRRLAGEQLSRRWPPAAEFTADLPLERREQIADMLAARWGVEFGAFDPVALAAAATGPAPSQAATIPPERLDQIQQMLSAAERGGPLDLPALEALGPSAVDVLERLLVERNVALPDAVYRKFLPSRSSEFAALEMLTSTDVNDRRHAADRLAELAKETPPRPLVTARIAQLGVVEDDGLVWRGLTEAVKSDTTEASTTLALAGLSHSSPEVRRMSCELLGRRPQPQHLAVLLTATGDPHVGTAAVAVKALAQPGLLTDPAPLEFLLTSGDNNLRFEAARTLQINGFASGAAAYERLAHDIDPEIRRRAAAAMAESGDRTFQATLVGLLSDSSLSVRKTAVDALVALIGSDISIRPNEPTPALSERVRLWQAWHAAQNENR